MLTIEPPFYQIRGVTIFRDHADDGLFYYLPPPPRLASRGPGIAFTLFKYRRDLTDNPALEPTRARGAGLLDIEVDAALDAATLASLQGDLGSLAGRSDVRLAPVLFRSGEVATLVAHVDGERLIEDAQTRTSAPLASPHHTAFAIGLTAEGATLVERAARGGALPVGVVYTFGFLALTPAVHAQATMDYDRVYDRLAASFGFEYPRVIRAELDAEIAWLIEHDAIHIEITAFTDGADRERQENLVRALIAQRVQQDFFRPSMPPSPAAAGSAGALGSLLGLLGGGKEPSASSAMFVLKAKYQRETERKRFTLSFDSRTAVELTHVATAFLSTLTAAAEQLDVREIDLDDPFFSRLAVRLSTAIDFAELADLSEAVVHLRHGDDRRAFSFSASAPGPYDYQAPLRRPSDDQYEYAAEYFFAAERGNGPTHIAAPPVTTRDRVLVIDPFAHFRYRRVRFLLGPLDPSEVARVHVHLRAPAALESEPDLVREEFVLDGEHPEYLFRQRLEPGPPLVPLRVRADWEDARGVVHEGDEAEVSGESWVVLGPFRDVLEVVVQPAVDWRQLTQIAVELRYDDGDYVVHRDLNFAAGDASASRRIEIPIRDVRRRRYTWRAVLFHSDGRTTEQPWTETDVRLLIVGKEPKNERDVRVVLVGSAPGVLGVRVDLFAEDVRGEAVEVSVFLRPGEDTEKVAAVPLDRDGLLRYRYEVRRYTAAGDELIKSGQSESPLLVVQPVPAG